MIPQGYPMTIEHIDGLRYLVVGWELPMGGGPYQPVVVPAPPGGQPSVLKTHGAMVMDQTDEWFVVS